MNELQCTKERASKGRTTQISSCGTAVVERAPCRCQERRVAHQLPQETHDWLVEFTWTLHRLPLILHHPFSFPITYSYCKLYALSLTFFPEHCVASYPSYLCCVASTRTSAWHILTVRFLLRHIVSLPLINALKEVALDRSVL